MKLLQHLPAGLAWAIVICLTGCATPRKLITNPAPSAGSGDSAALPAIYDPRPVSTLQGKASFYGKPQATASGERFNPRAMTAAHKTLPLHTVVRVVNLNNFKSVLVRINDRGPYVRGRIIDLSTAAAEKISMLGSGVVPVRVEILRKIEIMQKPNRRVSSTFGTTSSPKPTTKPAAKTAPHQPVATSAKKPANPTPAASTKKTSGSTHASPAKPTASNSSSTSHSSAKTSDSPAKPAHPTTTHRKHRKHHH